MRPFLHWALGSMKTPFLISICQLILVAIVCPATTVLGQAEKREPQVAAALQGITSQDLRTRDRAFYALLAQSGIEPHGASAMRVRVSSLLRNQPQQAEQIRIVLIAALEKQGGEFVRLIQEHQQPASEEFNQSWVALTSAVSGLQDPRAVKALLLALPAGSIDGLADVCPAAADAIIQRVYEPDLQLQGRPVGYRWQAITALSWCLQRPAMMRAYPDTTKKIRGALLSLLDDTDSVIRGSAAAALSTLRTDPEVAAKLRTLAMNDHYLSSPEESNVGPEKRTTQGRFTVRESAARSLNPPNTFFFYVTRTSDTRLCRIQETSEALTEEQFIGPERNAVLKPLMCSHYDPTGQDPSLCWKVEPANACSQ